MGREQVGLVNCKGWTGSCRSCELVKGWAGSRWVEKFSENGQVSGSVDKL